MAKDEKHAARAAEREIRDALRREPFVQGRLTQLVKVLPLPGEEDRKRKDHTVTGYVTMERYLLGMTPKDIEIALGLKSDRLLAGCCIFALQRQPGPSEVTHELTADYPDGVAFTVLSSQDYPPGDKSIHQWRLRVSMPATLICTLTPGATYKSSATP